MKFDGITQKQAMRYEIAASWWASWIFIEWMQKISCRYFAWKVHRKWKRYVATLEMCERVISKQKTETT